MSGTVWRVEGFTEIRELGAGAHGRVVLARHDTAGTPVAIKYLNRRDGDERAVARLREEAVMLGRVRDPHVVRLYRFVSGEHGAALVMEAVNGVSLREILAEHGALAPEAALTVLKGSLLGLAAAHSAGVVHRDYKPANVVVRADGLSKLIDFGIAGPAGDGGRSGTPAYMAPEQWHGEPASPATDVYAATCVFVECVAGRRPFTGGDLGTLRRLHLTEPPPAGLVPEPLRPLVEQGMAKDAADRPGSAAEFAAELERAARTAYGTDWEQRGLRIAAGAATALAALFPLVAAGLAPAGAVAAGAGGAVGTAGAAGAAGAAGGAAGAGGVAAGGGLAVVTGAKAAVAVATAAVVAAGGAGVYAVNRNDEPQRTAPVRVAVSPASYTRELTRPALSVSVRYPRVTGLRTSAIEAAANKALRAPVDTWVNDVHTDIGSFEGPDGSAEQYHPSATYRVGVAGPRLMSVRYDVRGGQRNTVYPLYVTVDLGTGREVTTADMLTARTATLEGAKSLTLLLERNAFEGGSLCKDSEPPWRRSDSSYGEGRYLLPKHITEGGLRMFLTARGAEFVPPHWALGYSMACNRNSDATLLRYDQLRGVLRPEIIQGATARS
ncbi:serine/threonine protein kinase [Thermomonospora echinospora]|uniref:non-specific serine/threonine protein kinase n=1 Tax=Thermomonospora echinospora TaxID=1992 RepID=A0A1H6CTU9_9ACTN|nr:serine/threonine-protein kinase [Thermomonospora echinospora]SEG76430.1 serine/threonine protein kinase [Thermomonospora echinospora]